MSDPALDPDIRQQLVNRLMRARRAVAAARKVKAQEAERAAHAEVDEVKHALGERGEPWWTDGSPDLNRRAVNATPYAEWFEALGRDVSGVQGEDP